MLWRIVELVCGMTRRLSRRNHQKYKLQNGTAICWGGGGGGHYVNEFKDWCETITWCCRCVEESSLRLAVKQSQLVTFRLA